MSDGSLSFIKTSKSLVFQDDNIEYYKCDVSNWEEVQIVAKKIQEEVH